MSLKHIFILLYVAISYFSLSTYVFAGYQYLPYNQSDAAAISIVSAQPCKARIYTYTDQPADALVSSIGLFDENTMLLHEHIYTLTPNYYDENGNLIQNPSFLYPKDSFVNTDIELTPNIPYILSLIHDVYHEDGSISKEISTYGNESHLYPIELNDEDKSIYHTYALQSELNVGRINPIILDSLAVLISYGDGGVNAFYTILVCSDDAPEITETPSPTPVDSSSSAQSSIVVSSSSAESSISSSMPTSSSNTINSSSSSLIGVISAKANSSANSNKSSSFGQVLGAQTPSCTPNLFQITPNNNTVTLYITPCLDYCKSWNIRYGSYPSTTQYQTLYTPGQYSGVEQVAIRSLSPNTLYAFSIACNSDGELGPFSKPLIARTGSTSISTLYNQALLLEQSISSINNTVETKVISSKVAEVKYIEQTVTKTGTKTITEAVENTVITKELSWSEKIITNYVYKPVQVVGQVITNTVQYIWQGMQNIWNAIKNGLTYAWNELMHWIAQGGRWVANTVQNIVNTVQNSVEQITETLSQWTAQIIEVPKKIISYITKDIEYTYQEKVIKPITFYKTVFTTITTQVTSGTEKINNWLSSFGKSSILTVNTASNVTSPTPIPTAIPTPTPNASILPHPLSDYKNNPALVAIDLAKALDRPADPNDPNCEFKELFGYKLPINDSDTQCQKDQKLLWQTDKSGFESHRFSYSQFYLDFNSQDIPDNIKEMYKKSYNWSPIIYPQDYIECVTFVAMSFNVAGTPIKNLSGDARVWITKTDEFYVYQSGISIEIPKVGDAIVWAGLNQNHIAIISDIDTFSKKIKTLNANLLVKEVIYGYDIVEGKVYLKSIPETYDYYKSYIPTHWMRKK